jgi:ElaB/YqjD/DUF883 family membrane-anchored ribosome-binding protein
VELWIAIFVIVAAIALILQMGILAGMYLEMREMMKRFDRMENRFDPIVKRVQRILEDSEEKIGSVTGDAAEITRLARVQAQKMDRLLTEAADRLRDQIIRTDHIVTGALEVVDEAGSRIRKTLWGPLQQASAVLKGVMVGLEVLRGQRRSRDSEAHQDEELFI